MARPLRIEVAGGDVTGGVHQIPMYRCVPGGGQLQMDVRGAFVNGSV
ncbi:MAG: hypothetical protein ABSH21_08550 [Verrucomicrobiia bacterium]